MVRFAFLLFATRWLHFHEAQRGRFGLHCCSVNSRLVFLLVFLFTATLASADPCGHLRTSKGALHTTTPPHRDTDRHNTHALPRKHTTDTHTDNIPRTRHHAPHTTTPSPCRHRTTHHHIQTQKNQSVGLFSLKKKRKVVGYGPS